MTNHKPLQSRLVTAAIVGAALIAALAGTNRSVPVARAASDSGVPAKVPREVAPVLTPTQLARRGRASIYTHTTVTGPGWYHRDVVVKSLGWQEIDLWAHVSYVSSNYIKVDDMRWWVYQWSAGDVCGWQWRLYNDGAFPVGDNINHLFSSTSGSGFGCKSFTNADSQWHLALYGRRTISDTYWYRGGCVGGYPSVMVEYSVIPSPGNEVFLKTDSLDLTHSGCG